MYFIELNCLYKDNTLKFTEAPHCCPGDNVTQACPLCPVKSLKSNGRGG